MMHALTTAYLGFVLGILLCSALLGRNNDDFQSFWSPKLAAIQAIGIVMLILDASGVLR